MRKIFLLLLSIFCLYEVSVASDTIYLEFDHFSQGPKYYNSGDWYVVLENEEDWEVYLNWKAPKNNYTGTFGLNKFLDDYSYIFTPENRGNGGIHFKDITRKVSVNEVSASLQQILIDATIIGTDGNVYIIHATHEQVNAKDEQEFSILDASLVQKEGLCAIKAQNTEWDIMLAVNSQSVIGSYPSLEYFDMETTRFVRNGKVVAPIRLSAVVGMAYMEDSTLSYVAECNMLGSDTVLYHMLLAVPLASPVDTVEVRCNNMRVDETYAEVYGMMSISASNATHEVQILYSDTELRAGEYTQETAQVYITELASQLQVEALTAQLQIIEEADGSYILVGEVRCADNVVYHLHLAWVVPVPTRRVNLSFDQTAQASYYPQMNNDLLLINTNDRYTVNFNVVGVQLGGEFDMEHIGTYYTSLVDDQSKRVVDIAQVDGTIYQSGDTTWIEADIIGFDSVHYEMSLWYAVPVPTDTVHHTFYEVEFDNHLEEGYFQFVGYSDDQTMMISLMPATTQVAGTYVNDGLFGRFGEGRYDFFNDYTFVQEWNTATRQYETYTVEKGQLTVAMAEDGTITADASIICENGKSYELTIYSALNRPRLEYDVDYGEVDKIYTTDDKITITDKTEEQGYIVFQAVSADQSDLLVLYMFAESADSEIVIPEGMYPINSSLTPGSVLASTGVNEDNSVSPSLYALCDADGYLQVPLYFLVDGTVEVTKNEHGDLHLEVNALNSYDVPVHIVYDAQSTDVEDVVHTQTSSNKVLRDGRLIINHQGKEYSILGVEINN